MFGIFINMEKQCTKCKLIKPIQEFCKNSRQKDGHFYICKECEKVRKKKEYYGGYSEVMKSRQGPERQAYNRDWYDDNIIRERVRHAKTRAKRKGYEFNITEEYVLELYESQNKICYITGIILSLEKHKHNTISLDRIDSSKGYVTGNVALCTDFINRAKSDYSLEEFTDILKQIKLIARV